MKKYLIGLIIVCSFFIFDLSVAQATKCCCAIQAKQSDDSWGVSSSTMRVYTVNDARDCLYQCKDDLYNIGGDYLYYELSKSTWRGTEDEITPQYCYDYRYTRNEMTDLQNFDTYLGCIVLNGGDKYEYLEVFAPYPNGNIYEGILMKTFSNFTEAKPTKFTEAHNILMSRINERLAQSDVAVVESFSYVFPKNRGDDGFTSLTVDAGTACLLLYEAYKANPESTKYKFDQNPYKDEIRVLKFPDSNTGDLVPVDNIEITTDQEIVLITKSSFQSFVDVMLDVKTSNLSVVGIVDVTPGVSFTIKGGVSGGAVINIKSNWGGEKSIVVKNSGIGISDRVAKIKNKCLELSETSNNIEDLRNSCNEISATTAEAAALLKCKEAAAAFDDQTKIAEREAQCDELKAEAPKIGGEEGKGTALYNDMVAQIQKFSSSGLVGTGKSVPLIIGELLKYVFGIIGSVAFAIFVYGGLSYMFSGGDKKKVTEAKDTFLWAILGLAAIFLSYSVLNFIISKL